MSATDLVTLCEVADLDEDVPQRAEHDGVLYAIYTRDGTAYVTADLCTHGPGYMSEGFIEGDEIECPFHQGRFNFITGAVTMAPCVEPLRTWTAHVVDGKVCIDPGETRA